MFDRDLFEEKLTKLLKPFLDFPSNFLNVKTNPLHIATLQVDTILLFLKFELFIFVSSLCLADQILIQFRVKSFFLLIQVSGQQMSGFSRDLTDVMIVVLLEGLTCGLDNIVQTTRLLGFGHFDYKICAQHLDSLEQILLVLHYVQQN